MTNASLSPRKYALVWNVFFPPSFFFTDDSFSFRRSFLKSRRSSDSSIHIRLRFHRYFPPTLFIEMDQRTFTLAISAVGTPRWQI